MLPHLFTLEILLMTLLAHRNPTFPGSCSCEDHKVAVLLHETPAAGRLFSGFSVSLEPFRDHKVVVLLHKKFAFCCALALPVCLSVKDKVICFTLLSF